MNVPDEEDDPFEEQREQAENPMRRLFLEYGSDNAFAFTVGLLSSVVARVLDLLPPVLLGIALDAIIRDDKRFVLWPLSTEWTTSLTSHEQLWLVTAIIAFSFFGGATFHWTRNWGWNSFAQHIQHAVRTD
ncbi:MAG: ABC transporter ATP-binding protein, partial [archaeon]